MPPRKKRCPAGTQAKALWIEAKDAGSNIPIRNSHPWPRVEGTPIRIRRRMDDEPAVEALKPEVERRAITEEWDDYDSLFYNAWLKEQLKQTRVADARAIRSLRIEDDVLRLLQNAGLGTIATRHYPMYPDLVRQFLASVRVYYVDEVLQRPSQGTLTFIVRGIRYRVSFDDLAAIYGFGTDDRVRVSLPEHLPGVREFWAMFGTHVYESKSATHTDVRHPAVRYVIRLLSTTLLCKNEPGKMRVQELAVLYQGLRRDFPQELPEIPEDVHYGAVFAHHLVSLKKTPFEKTSSKPVTVGSLLTPIFRFCGIGTSGTTEECNICTIDIAYLRQTTWLKDLVFWTYRNVAGERVKIELPLPDQFSIAGNLEALRFEPDPRLVRPLTTRSTSGRQSARSTGEASSSRVPEPLPGFPETPEFPMDQADFQRSVFQSLRAIWHRMTSGCVRPRSRSPSPPATSATSEEAED